MGAVGRLHYLTMTAENATPGDLALAPLVTCKLCLCEQPLDKMTTLQECRCIFCTAVSFPCCFLLEKMQKEELCKCRIRFCSLLRSQGLLQYDPAVSLQICLQIVSRMVNPVFTASQETCNVCVRFHYWLNKWFFCSY